MATNFPTSLDALTNPTATDQVSVVSHADQHANANDAIEALEAKVGVDGSAVTTSHDYKIAALESGKVAANASITGATKTKITYDAKGLVTGGADATTADIADSSNKRYVTDAQLIVIGNTSGTNTGDQNLSGYVPYTGATTNVNIGANIYIGHALRSDTSDGVLIEAANGTDIGLLGAGNTANVTWYGSHNYDVATQDTIAAFTGAGKTLGSLATATYPSLTELSYVKGVTSAIQTQLNAKTSSAVVPSTAPSAGQILIGNAGGTAYAANTLSGSGATFSLSSAGVLTVSGIANASLTNSSITIAGTSTALGGSITQDTITGLSSTGLIKRTGANTLAVATAGTDYSAGTSALATGILKSTTTTGALSIAVAGDFPTLNQNTTGSAATLTTTRTIWGQDFNGSGNVTGSLTDVTDITGGASSMIITAGTGNSRTMTLRTTTAGGTATTALTIGADQSSTFAGTVALGANNLTMTGSLAATGARVTKGWFTDIESTNMPTVGGTSLSSTFQPLDSTLTSLAAYNTSGFVTQTAADTFTGRSLVDNDGITWTNPAGAAGNPTPNISAVKSIWIPAQIMYPGGGSSFPACAALANAAYGLYYNASYLAFDPALDEGASFLLAMPNGWDKGSIQYQAYWSHPATATNFTVRWVIGAKAIANGVDMTSSTIAQAGVNDTGGNTNYLYIADKGTLTIGSPADYDMIMFNIVRNGSAGADTLAVDAYLHGIMLYFTINTLVDT